MSSYGSLTVKGSKKFDEKLALVLDNISSDIKLSVSKDLYEAVILIGGYGRGEGGVVKINGEEFPHNNFDFIVISKDLNSEDKGLLEDLCTKVFDSNTKDLGISIEFTVVNSSKLKSMDPLLITYDMKYGHKLIVGNSDSLKNNKNFELETIPSWDVRNLIVNRGTLLIINDLILNKESISEKDKKTIVKHWIKAIIGYGDALLYYLGEYHFSYVEKQKRMQNLNGVDPTFRDLYNQAMNFRFTPNYKIFENCLLEKYQLFIKDELKNIHYQCEQLALNNVKIDSLSYINKAINESLNSNTSLKANLKKLYYLTKNVPNIKQLTFLENIQFRMLGIKGLMPILFPFVAYEIKSEIFDEILQDFFQTNKNETNHLKNQYLSYWKTYVNDNFVREDFGL